MRAVELAGAAFGTAAALIMMAAPSEAGPVALAASALILAWVVWQDGKSFTIPNGAVAALALIGCAARVADYGPTLETALSLAADVALTGGALWLIREAYFRLRGVDGLGFGDVKLAAAAGCLVGALGFAFALLAASLAGLAVAGLRGATRAERIAFGAFLGPAVWTILAAQRLAPQGLAG